MLNALFDPFFTVAQSFELELLFCALHFTSRHSLKAAWFQPLKREMCFPGFSNFALLKHIQILNLYRSTRRVAQPLDGYPGHRRARSGSRRGRRRRDSGRVQKLHVGQGRQGEGGGGEVRGCTSCIQL
jgi:hypothetical protein